MSPYEQIMSDVKLLLSHKLVQVVLLVTWARVFFPDWVEAVGANTIMKILGVS